MSAAGRPHEDAPAHAAAAMRDAGFVRLVGTADGDALAATGLLARALEAVDTPFQASLAAVPEPSGTDADCVVAVGHDAGSAAVSLDESPLSVAAADVAADLAADAVDPTLALAGATCAGAEPSGDLLEAAGLERRPGVALPTADLADGLAASTLVHADFSGEPARAEAFVDDVRDGGDDDYDADETDQTDGADGATAPGNGADGDGTVDGRALASAVAMAAVEDAVPRAADTVQRALRPYETERFETLGGYADVLAALAAEQPGVGIALALGRDVDDAAIEAWRDHGQRAHRALRSGETGRFDGLSVVRVDADAPLRTVARLQFGYLSPEPVVLALADGTAAVHAADGTSISAPFRAAADALGGRATVRDGHGIATFDGARDDYLDAFREAR